MFFLIFVPLKIIGSQSRMKEDQVDRVAVRALKRKEYRKRSQTRRYEFLAAMKAEERKDFLEKEREINERRKTEFNLAKENGLNIVIDLVFDKYMSQKEINSLAKQIKLSYGMIRRMDNPFALHLVHFKDGDRIADALEKIQVRKWPIQLHKESLCDVFTTDVIYFSPDATTVLQDIDPSKVYVVGGLVDRSRIQCASKDTASEFNIQTVRLPIQEHIKNRTNGDHILNLNTVIQILAAYQATGDWKHSILATVPKRKQNQTARTQHFGPVKRN